jgi:diadenosine tetraphosphatase ApaH/serine/threonine PP2A family protein phosphatase
VIVNGDTVNRGPCSAACLRFVLDKRDREGWHVLRGNHEEYLLERAHPDLAISGPEFELNRFAHWSYEQLNGEVEQLAHLAERFSWVAPDGREFRVRHASMASSRQGLYEELSDEEMLALIAPAPAVFVASHTHQAFVRQVGDTCVVNTGSVGAPFDQDWRSSYGRFTWDPQAGWEAAIQRVPYDRRLIEADYESSGFLTDGGPLAQLMLVELRRAGGLIYRWASRYQSAVLDGSISVEESVHELLQDEDLRPFLGAPGWES